MIEKMIETRTSVKNLGVAVDNGLSFCGYAATWETYDMSSFAERIEPAAFTRAIVNADVMALLNHDSTLPLARTTNGSLRLTVDDVGLRCDFDAVDTSYARDMSGLVRAGVLSSMSFGFRCLADLYEPRAGTTPLRVIQDLEILEVSVVAFPANPGTSIDTRGLDLWRAAQAEASAQAEGTKYRRRYICLPS